MADLPNEITMIILSNLPVKSLLCFKCVSKSWCSWISCPKFEFSNQHRQGAIITVYPHPYSTTKRICRPSFRFINQQLTLEEPNYCSSDYEDNHIVSCMILGSCHGLILFNLNEHIYLWNPATRFLTKVLENVNFLGGYITHGGLCYDSSKYTYKVVLIMRYMTSDGDRFVTIASLEDKHWRQLEFPYDIHTVNYYGITLHERLHYYVPDVKNVEDDNDENSDEDDGNNKGIWDRLSDSPRKSIYLDPITEKLHMFPMPEPKNNQQENIIVGLGVLNECLCMSREPIPDKLIADDQLNPAYKAWVGEDQFILSWIVASLHTLSHDNASIETYVQKAKGIADRLADLQHPIDDDDLIEFVLAGLGPAYRPFTRALEARQEDVTFDALYGMLLSEERQLKRLCTLQSVIPRALWDLPLTRQPSPLPKCAARVGVSESTTPHGRRQCTIIVYPYRQIRFQAKSYLNSCLLRLDISNAYLHGHLDEVVYMSQPPNFADPSRPDHVCLLKRLFYKLKQSPRMWNKCLTDALISFDFSSVATPASSSSRLSFSDGQPFHDQILFQSIVGALQYLTFTRPDIAYLVNKVSQFMHSPLDSHWMVVKRILRYIRSTPSHGLFFNWNSSPFLHGYSDADWGGSLDDRKSTNGFSIYLGSHLISWASRKQKYVSRSITESEYRALVCATSELTWLEMVLKEIGCLASPAPILWCDNLSATYLTANPIFHSRTKHMEIDFHFVHEKVRDKALIVKYLNSHDQITAAPDIEKQVDSVPTSCST
ncbi:hypothetical protein CQW23_16455 [Capsicum baccatum]|uniref:F-box domain-containing protein n=1 Tax=Capsicum baccatum TaxID=33114 RepID=A0A2G2WBF3_CAPBA|nr:hypothetical protein CQW23_16455 [Capsicum baccatum]